VYTSPTRGDFDLVETFAASTRVFDRDFPSAFRHLLDIVTAQIREAQADLSVDISQVMSLHVQTVCRQINAITTRGGPVHNLCDRALHWPGGKGSSDQCIRHAERALVEQGGTQQTIQEIAESLAGAMNTFVESLRERVADRIGIFEEHSGDPRQETRKCIICQDALAVGRSAVVICECSPRPPYACRQCIAMIDLQLRHCPMCRGQGQASQSRA